MQDKQISWLIVAALGIFLISALLSFPVWKQNQYNQLVRQRVSLERLLDEVEGKVSLLDLKLNALQSRERLEIIAQKLGLEYSSEVVKIKYAAQGGLQ
jgi:cell division protein FtsL